MKEEIQNKDVNLSVKSFPTMWLNRFLVFFLALYAVNNVQSIYAGWNDVKGGVSWSAYFESPLSEFVMLMQGAWTAFSIIAGFMVDALMYMSIYKLIKLLYCKYDMELMYKKRMNLFWLFFFVNIAMDVYFYGIFFLTLWSNYSGMHGGYRSLHYVNYVYIGLVTLISLFFVNRFRIALNFKSLYSVSLLCFLFYAIVEFGLGYVISMVQAWLEYSPQLAEIWLLPLTVLVHALFEGINILLMVYFIYKTNEYIVKFNELKGYVRTLEKESFES